MPRALDTRVLAQEIASFHAEVRRLVLALVEQALAAELARWRAALPDPARLAAAVRVSRRRSRPSSARRRVARSG